MPTVSVRIEGLSELGDAIRKHTENIQKSIARQAVKKAAEITAAKAFFLVPSPMRGSPYATGALQKSIGTKRLSKASHPGFELWAVGVIGDKAERAKKKQKPKTPARRGRKAAREFPSAGPMYYWKFIEFGTVKMPRPQPFLGPALRMTAGRATDVMAAEIRNALSRLRAKERRAAMAGAKFAGRTG